jgi:hypothetical protein
MDLEAKPLFIKAEICRQEPSAIGEVNANLKYSVFYLKTNN